MVRKDDKKYKIIHDGVIMKNRALFLILLFLSFSGLDAIGGEQTTPDLQSLKILDLKTAQKIALADNPGLAAARERIEQARARVKQAEAAWWPSLDFSGSAARARLSDYSYEQAMHAASRSGITTDQDQESYNAGLNATWVLFDGFKRKFSEQAARLDEEAGNSDHHNSQRLLILAVGEAYLNAQLAGSGADIAAANASFYERQLQDAEALYDNGSGSLSDLLNIKVRINSARTDLLSAKREKEAALYGLAALMGLKNSLFPGHIALDSIDEQLDVTVKRDVDKLIATAWQTRPDVHKTELQLKQIKALLGQADALFYPALILGGGFNGSRTDDFGMSSDDIGSNISLNMTWNLFRGGADKARRLEVLAGKRETTHRLQDLRNRISSEVRQAVAMLEAAGEQVLLQRQSVTLVERNRELTENEYKAGQGTLTRLNEAQRDLVTIKSRLSQALVGFKRAEQTLLATTGQNL